MKIFLLMLTLHLPSTGHEFEVRFDDFRSKGACISAKIRLMQHIQDESLAGKRSYITKIRCQLIKTG